MGVNFLLVLFVCFVVSTSGQVDTTCQASTCVNIYSCLDKKTTKVENCMHRCVATAGITDCLLKDPAHITYKDCMARTVCSKANLAKAKAKAIKKANKARKNSGKGKSEEEKGNEGAKVCVGQEQAQMYKKILGPASGSPVIAKFLTCVNDCVHCDGDDKRACVSDDSACKTYGIVKNTAQYETCKPRTKSETQGLTVDMCKCVAEKLNNQAREFLKKKGKDSVQLNTFYYCNSRSQGSEKSEARGKSPVDKRSGVKGTSQGSEVADTVCKDERKDCFNWRKSCSSKYIQTVCRKQCNQC